MESHRIGVVYDLNEAPEGSEEQFLLGCERVVSLEWCPRSKWGKADVTSASPGATAGLCYTRKDGIAVLACRQPGDEILEAVIREIPDPTLIIIVPGGSKFSLAVDDLINDRKRGNCVVVVPVKPGKMLFVAKEGSDWSIYGAPKLPKIEPVKTELVELPAAIEPEPVAVVEAEPPVKRAKKKKK